MLKIQKHKFNHKQHLLTTYLHINLQLVYVQKQRESFLKKYLKINSL